MLYHLKQQSVCSQIPANHLLAASVMSAPAALAIAKVMYPSTTKSAVNPKDAYNVKIE